MSAPSLVLLAAGGTGGHLFPAQALATELAARGVAIELATDERAANYAKEFPARRIHPLPAATPSGGSPLKKLGALFTLGRGVLAARGMIGKTRPDAIVGFGGYPTVPPMLAGSMLGVTTILHEQNGVMGRANKFLAGRATAIATGFAEVRGVEGKLADKATHVGNPVRAAVIAAAATPFRWAATEGVLRVLVFGGSQGARVMSDVAPAALSALPPEMRARLRVVQQARLEDVERVRHRYEDSGIEAVVEPFFSDLPARMAESHLVISRSGASTVAELGVIGRPSILVPLPGAIDQDQAANAETLMKIGAAKLLPQSEFIPRRLTQEIEQLMNDPAWLTSAAAAAKSAGIPDAAARLAALVGRVARLAEFKES
ncbi:undecaprenyldiphospho-muramoylpentapeptide beta-N-acetylglucosaminyltransferase [Terrarubrum flagellatum]|uniref:undecaprenyldiphospho-muramoylpentapeptide beta-N-acetylglucosaminyltransferase n=1 Tax=Terrirubrum flagellatum TaxID=2895980 RepID=UPI0031453117